MSGYALTRRGLGGLTAAVAVGLVAWNDVVVPRLRGLPGSTMIEAPGAAGLALTAAGWAGLTREELGLDGSRLPVGLRWGSACVAPLAAGYAALLAVPATRPLLADARTAGLNGRQLAHRVLVRIPFGTVVGEEVAFRGVLLGLLLRLAPVPTAVAVSSAVFGLWHVRPALDGHAANRSAHGAGAAVVLTCAGTASAAVLLAGLRLGSGSLLAPAMLHLAANALGTLAAAAASRRRGPSSGNLSSWRGGGATPGPRARGEAPRTAAPDSGRGTSHR